MKELNEQEYNKMCAEFMGLTVIPAGTKAIGKIHFPEVSEAFLKYDVDWNSIMEVVEKINSINLFENPSDTTLLTIREEMGAYLGLSNKEAVVNSIWEFLNWYKTQTA